MITETDRSSAFKAQGFAIGDEDRARLTRLSKRLGGASLSAVVRLAVRELAERYGVEQQEEPRKAA
jgi:hypothetical protein